MPLRRNRPVAWIAACAVLLQALWPLLSHARTKDPSLQMPVCTIDGVTHFLEIKIGKTPLEERTSLHGEHCKLCVFGDGRAALNAVVESVVAPRVTSHKVVRLQRSLQEQPPLLSAHPRAPPAVS